MSPRALAICTAMAAALLAMYFIGGRSGTPAPSAGWSGFDRASVSGIEVTRPGLPTVTFRKEGVRWMRSKDTQVTSADTGSFTGFVGMLADLRAFDVVSDSPAKYPKFGLDRPVVTIRIEDSSSVKVLIFGSESERGEFVYGRCANDPRVWAIKGFDPWGMERLLE